MSLKSEHDGRELWIGGYPLLDEREMTVEERAAVTARIVKLKKARQRWKFAILAFAPALLVSIMPYADSTSMAASVAGMSSAAISLIIFAVGPLRLRDLKRNVADEIEHLRCGLIASMDLGRLEYDLYEQATDRLGLETAAEMKKPITIEVYSTTGIIATTDQQDSDGSRIGLARVAPRPKAASSAPALLGENMGKLVRFRPMTATERIELDDYDRSLAKQSPLWPPIGLTGWAGLAALGSLASKTKQDPSLGFYVVVALAIFYWAGWLQSFLYRRRLRTDVSNGKIATQEIEPEELLPGGPHVGSIEYLPKSQLLWVVDGESAEWRRIGV